MIKNWDLQKKPLHAVTARLCPPGTFNADSETVSEVEAKQELHKVVSNYSAASFFNHSRHASTSTIHAKVKHIILSKMTVDRRAKYIPPMITFY
jgi:hypothetical protein